jgi:hypothetical protein
MDATARWPESALERASLAELAHRLPVGSQDPDKRALRRSATDKLLGWLESWPGATWQQRWIASGSEPLGAAWVAAPAVALQASVTVTATVARRTMVVGMSTLLCLGVLRPGYAWLFACRLKATYGHVRELADPEFFAQALAHYQAAGHRQRHQLDALNHLSRVMLHTGRGPRQLTAADLLDYHANLRALSRQADAITLAWDLLRDLGVLPAGTPSLRAAAARPAPRRRAGRCL